MPQILFNAVRARDQFLRFCNPSFLSVPRICSDHIPDLAAGPRGTDRFFPDIPRRALSLGRAGRGAAWNTDIPSVDRHISKHLSQDGTKTGEKRRRNRIRGIREGYSFHPCAPISGTKTQGIVASVRGPSDVLTTLRSRWPDRSPTGMTILPPILSCSTRGAGISG